MSFQPASENKQRCGGSDVLESLFQTEVVATTKVRSPIEESQVAGMASKDDAAERRCFRPGTSAICRTSDVIMFYCWCFFLWNWNLENKPLIFITARCSDTVAAL